MARVVVGTAGHIDHGKSTLVRALTGTDPDRLPEEKRRGITIDLGYAFLDDVAAIIDVPGHEKLIRNMVAGAATIDYALLVVAATDGVMPQTTEHLAILSLLGVPRGSTVITMCDAVEPEWLDLVEEQVRGATARTFLADAEIHLVDSLSGRGIADLRGYLLRELRVLPPRADRGVFRLPIDRVFTIHGRGTVVTGTILAGAVRRDARLVAMPGGHHARVKNLETHGCEVNELSVGQRAALNVVGDVDRLARGITLTEPSSLIATSRTRALLTILSNVARLQNRMRVRVLIGTQELIGRLQILGDGGAGRVIVNLLLESEMVCAWGDRFIFRRYSPMETLGGGVVVEPQTRRLKSRELADEIAFTQAAGSPELREALMAFIRWRGSGGIADDDLAARFGMMPSEVIKQCGESRSSQVIHHAGFLILLERVQAIEEQILQTLAVLHRADGSRSGFAVSELRESFTPTTAPAVLDVVIQRLLDSGRMVREGSHVRLTEAKASLSATQETMVQAIRQVLRAEKFTPSSSSLLAGKIGCSPPDVERALVLMERLGFCRRLGVDLFFDAEEFDRGVNAMKALLKDRGMVTVSEAAQHLSSSRKYIVPFLEYLDSKGITRRDGNVRVPGQKIGSDP